MLGVPTEVDAKIKTHVFDNLIVPLVEFSLARLRNFPLDPAGQVQLQNDLTGLTPGQQTPGSSFPFASMKNVQSGMLDGTFAPESGSRQAGGASWGVCYSPPGDYNSFTSFKKESSPDTWF